MIKVGFIIDGFSFNGGVERVLSNLSISLPKKYKQYIIVIHNAESHYEDGIVRDWEHNAQIINLNLKVLNPKVRNPIVTFLVNKIRAKSLLKIKKELNLDFYVSVGYNSNNLNIESNSVGKTILSIHSFQKGLKNKVKYYKYPQADKIVTVSNGVSDLLTSYYGIDKNKIRTIYNLFDIKKIAKSTTEEELFDKNEFNILMVGRLDSVKGQWHAIDIVSKIISENQTNIKLNIIGGGPLEAELKKLVDKKNIKEKVSFLGFKDNVYKYMSQADILLVTSMHEGFAMVIVEALACSLPVVSVDCKSGPKEILSNDQSENITELKIVDCGALYPSYTMETNLDNINEEDSYNNKIVADFIIELINNKEMLNSFKKNCYIRAMDFDKKKIIKEWIDLFNI